MPNIMQLKFIAQGAQFEIYLQSGNVNFDL